MANIWKKTLKALCCACISLCAVACVACSETPEQSSDNKFTVTYNGVSVTESTATVDDDALLVKPNDPTREHYVFDGWYNGEEKWDFSADKVTENVTLTAKWTAKTYTVKFVAQDGETVVAEKTYTCENIEAFEEPAVPAAPQHFENGRWNKAKADYLTYSEETIVVVATYDRVQYSVTFMNGGEEVKAVSIGANLVISDVPQLSEKDYYVFDGWYNGEEKWDFQEDVVTGALVLTAKFVAKEYVVILKDVAGNETELKYTVENVEEFELPTPVAPEHYSNARWNKTAEECTVYSETPIVVEMLCDVATYTVSFVGADGVESSQEVEYNQTVSAPETAPKADGYLFQGWVNEDGEAFDFETPISGNTTVVASWLAIVQGNKSNKTVVASSDIQEGVQVEVGYVSKNGTENNPNVNWYFDSDYFSTGNFPSVTDPADANKFATWMKFGLTADGGAGDVAEGRDTYIVLPAFNYTLYAKVDFAINQQSAKVMSMSVAGNDVSSYAKGNKLISIITDATGTHMIYRDINDTPYHIDVLLSDEIATGKEGLRIDFKVSGYVGLCITEYHVTPRTYDYKAEMASLLAKLPANAEDLTGSEEETALIAQYLQAENYMTASEKANYVRPEVISAVTENIYYSAVINAETGSQAQAEAIEAYRAYSDTLSEELKNGETHKANVAAINEIIAANFAEVKKTSVDSLAKSESSNFTEANVGLIPESASQFKNEDKYETFSYATGATKNAKFVLNAFNYNAYSEVYFGVAFAATAEKGVVTINGETLEVPSGLIGHFYKMKAVVKDGYLTLIDDGSTDAVKNGATDYAENGYFFKVKLSESVLNGAESLVINFETGASSTYCWFEVTSMVAVTEIAPIE